MIVVGIDPGQSGAVAVLDGDNVAVHDMPLTDHVRRKRVDAVALFGLLGVRPDLVVVEEVHGRPGNGAAATFTFGMGLGAVLAVLELGGHPFQLVTPQRWKADVLAGTAKDKAAAVAWAQARFPRLGKLRHDRAEALCLAWWGRTKA